MIKLIKAQIIYLIDKEYYEFSRKVINIVFLLQLRYILNNLLFVGNPTCWIDVCPTDSNLLASGGVDKSINIFDKRESRIVKTIDDIHSRKI